jgi:hypothetical protein
MYFSYFYSAEPSLLSSQGVAALRPDSIHEHLVSSLEAVLTVHTIDQVHALLLHISPLPSAVEFFSSATPILRTLVFMFIL